MHVESLGVTELVEAVGRTLPFDGGRKRSPREGQYQGEKTQPIRAVAYIEALSSKPCFITCLFTSCEAFTLVVGSPFPRLQYGDTTTPFRRLL